MTEVQKIIKYLAIAFAIFLIFNIIYGVMFGIQSVFSIFSDDDSDKVVSLHELSIPNVDLVSNLDVDLAYADLVVQIGDEFKVETNRDSISCRQDGNTILLEENGDSWFFNKNKESKVVITVTDNFNFNEVDIENGAGKISIEELNANRLSFDFGAGKTEIEGLNVLEKAEIDGGAGEIKILSGEINNLDMDMGVGKFFLKSRLIGDHQIDAGVGEMDLDILGDSSDYSINVDKGIGTISINGKKVSDEYKYGNGSNSININGGVGTISVDIISSDE